MFYNRKWIWARSAAMAVRRRGPGPEPVSGRGAEIAGFSRSGVAGRPASRKLHNGACREATRRPGCAWRTGSGSRFAGNLFRRGDERGALGLPLVLQQHREQGRRQAESREHQQAAGEILRVLTHEANQIRTDETADGAEAVDEREAAGGGGAGQEIPGQGPEHAKGAPNSGGGDTKAD